MAAVIGTACDAGEGRDRVSPVQSDAAAPTTTPVAPARGRSRQSRRAAAAPCRRPPDAVATWRGHFETGDLSQWSHVQQKRSSRIRLVEDPSRQGRYAGRVEVHPEDVEVAGSGAHQRAELVGPRVPSPDGEEQWWTWSTYLAPGFAVSEGGWVVLTQIHTVGDGLPNVTVSANADGRVDLGVRGGDAGAPVERFMTVIERVRTARWYDFELRVRWSPTAARGLVALCVDGRPAVRATRAATSYRDRGVYFKQGIYRSRSPLVSVVYHDGATLYERRGG